MNLYNEVYQLRDQFSMEDKIIGHELAYYVFKDLSHVFGIYVETNASLEYFKYSQQHKYIEIAKNRLIVQINLSCGIMYDLYKLYEKKLNIINYFTKLKQLSQQYLVEMMGQIKPVDQLIQEYINHYMYKILLVNNQINMLPTTQIVKQENFDQSLLDKIFRSMEIVDKEIQEIKQGKQFLIPEINSLFDQAFNRYNIAESKLKNNFQEENDKRIQYLTAQKYGFV